MAKRYGMVMDVTRCNGCYNCFLSCRDEHCGNEHPPIAASQPYSGHFWMRMIERERGKYPKVKVAYTAVPCMQCEKPLCVEMSSDGAVYQRADGIVVIDPEKAAGQKGIVNTCPYRVIYWNEEKELAQKCTFCAHLLDQGWKEPRCVEACPTGALIFGDTGDANSEISKLIASKEVEVLHPEYGLNPQVKYIGLPKRFIAGEVVLSDREDECAEGVSVVLVGEGVKKAVKTDNYGDFEFEGLEQGEYVVKMEHAGYGAKEITVKTHTDVYLGEIVLSK